MAMRNDAADVASQQPVPAAQANASPRSLPLIQVLFGSTQSPVKKSEGVPVDGVGSAELQQPRSAYTLSGAGNVCMSPTTPRQMASAAKGEDDKDGTGTAQLGAVRHAEEDEHPAQIQAVSDVAAEAEAIEGGVPRAALTARTTSLTCSNGKPGDDPSHIQQLAVAGLRQDGCVRDEAEAVAAMAISDMHTSILYAEADKIFEHLQDSRSLADLAEEFEKMLRSLQATFSTSATICQPGPAAAGEAQTTPPPGCLADAATKAAAHTAALCKGMHAVLLQMETHARHSAAAASMRASLSAALAECSRLDTAAGEREVFSRALHLPRANVGSGNAAGSDSAVAPQLHRPWARQHEAMRLTRVAFHCLQQLSASGLGHFNLDLHFVQKSDGPASASVEASAPARPARAPQSPSDVGTPPAKRRVSELGPAAADAAAADAPAAPLSASLPPTSPRKAVSLTSAAGGHLTAAPRSATPLMATPIIAGPSLVSAALTGTPAAAKPLSDTLQPIPLTAPPLTTAPAAATKAPSSDGAAKTAEAARRGGERNGEPATNAPQRLPPPASKVDAAAFQAAAASMRRPPSLQRSTAPQHIMPRHSLGDNMAVSTGTKGAAPDLRLPGTWPAPAGSAGGDDHRPQTAPSGARGAADGTTEGKAQGQAAASDLDQPLATRRSPRNASRRAFSALANNGPEVKTEQSVPNTPVPLAAPPSRGVAADQSIADPARLAKGSPVPPVSAAPAASPPAAAEAEAPPAADGEHVPVTTEELVRSFAEASELRMRALGAMGLVDDGGGGRGHKRRRVDGGRTFHPTIGIGNVGKKGGSDVPGGVQVSMVALCDYILRHGGWETMKSDRDLKLRLLQHFGWGGAGSTGRAATFRADKAVQSLTTQVREYFVKTGVFQILASHRSTAGTSARPSVSATTAAPAVSAGSPPNAPAAPSASSSPPQDPARFAMRMHDHATAVAGRRPLPEEATATDLLRDAALDSETQRRLQLAAGAFRDPGPRASSHTGTAGDSLGMPSGQPGQHGSSSLAAAGGPSLAQSSQPLHALLHAIDVMQERESPARQSEGNMEDSAAAGPGPMHADPPAASAASAMSPGGHLHDAAALLLATSGAGAPTAAASAAAASVALPVSLTAGSSAPALLQPQAQLPLDVQQMLAGALRAQLAASAPAPMPWVYGGGSSGLDALALQHWWATAGGLPGAAAPAGDAVLREVQNMFGGDAPPAPKEER
eukprot:jgi/Ulvmu1/8739/UM047_0080.1